MMKSLDYSLGEWVQSQSREGSRQKGGRRKGILRYTKFSYKATHYT
jgi:hypothetical protein